MGVDRGGASVMAGRAEGAATCAHCGLAVPSGLVRAGAVQQFCCHGCETAYGVIQGCGLAGYYELLRASGDSAPRGEAAGRFAEFDQASFGALYVRASPDGLASVEFVLEGLHCAACVWLLEKLGAVVPGVVSSRVEFRRGMIAVRYEPGRVKPSAIAGALSTLGYVPHPARERAARGARVRADRKALVNLAIAGACAGNVMLLAFALYGGVLGGIQPLYEGLFRWASMGIGLLSLCWPGRVFFQSAWSSLRTRTANLDVPIVMALVAGGVMGTINTITGRGEIYFDSLTALVFLLLVGRFVQNRQQRWALDSVELLHALTPAFAWRVGGDGAVTRTPIEAIETGELVEVRAGESIPVDGTVEYGSTHVDQSILSGESRPVAAGEGAGVLAGAVNLSAPIRVRATATGEQTRAGRLMKLVEDAAQRRAPILRLIDRVGVCFIAGVSLLTGLTLAVWWGVDRAAAIDHAVAMLIVTCPCALALAAPLAVGVTIGRASRRGMLIKGGDVFERLSRRGLVLLDKTGTITQGKMGVRWWVGDRASQRLAAAVESVVSHPIAQAIVEIAPGPLPMARGVRQTVGAGVEGWVNNHRVVVGHEAFVRASGAAIDGNLSADLERMRAQGLTGVIVAVDGRACAVAGLGDALRPEAKRAVEELRGMGFRVGLLSGDHPSIVARVGRELGLDEAACVGGVSPEDKAAFVQRAALSGPVVMVGDGVNDAAALAAAGVGIAVRGGAEASLSAADVYLARPGLEGIVDLARAGRGVMHAIAMIVGVSLIYNLVSASLTLLGVIHPMIAAAIMPISSLSVLTVAMKYPTLRRGACR
jgi:Cu2+-exporting ATPase